jgi:hypothetical protein
LGAGKKPWVLLVEIGRESLVSRLSFNDVLRVAAVTACRLLSEPIDCAAKPLSGVR